MEKVCLNLLANFAKCLNYLKLVWVCILHLLVLFWFFYFLFVFHDANFINNFSLVVQMVKSLPLL
jgi:hypothetical protein